LENDVHVIEASNLYGITSSRNKAPRYAHTNVLVTAEVVEEPDKNQNAKAIQVDGDVYKPDLSQASLGKDPLKNKLEAENCSRIAQTLVLMLVIFLIAQPSPDLRCRAATTQP
jgi:hypothetical protein